MATPRPIYMYSLRKMHPYTYNSLRKMHLCPLQRLLGLRRMVARCRHRQYLLLPKLPRTAAQGQLRCLSVQTVSCRFWTTPRPTRRQSARRLTRTQKLQYIRRWSFREYCCRGHQKIRRRTVLLLAGGFQVGRGFLSKIKKQHRAD